MERLVLVNLVVETENNFLSKDRLVILANN